MAVAQWLLQGASLFFEYDTPKIVHIKSKKIGIFSRLIQLLIISYIVGFVLVYKKGYQERGAVVSAVTTKLKGALLTNFTPEEVVGVREEWRGLYSRVWDTTDLVVPPVENNAFFITTNLEITPNQTRGECPAQAALLPCREDWECRGEVEVEVHGVPTGHCNLTTLSCTLAAWCPMEEDALPLGPDRAVLEATSNFTVLIKNMITFPLFNKSRTNILDWQNSSFLSSCHNLASEQPFCPVFTLGNIVAATSNSYAEMAVRGGVINIDILWDCNLDLDFLTHCRPVYTFTRLDNPEARIAPGSNFRHAEYFNDNRRNLVKAYGITFIVNVHGQAGRFGVWPTLLNLGAGLALLSLATVICDIVVLYCHKHREYYRQSKYQEVTGADAYRGGNTIHTTNPTIPANPATSPTNPAFVERMGGL